MSLPPRAAAAAAALASVVLACAPESSAPSADRDASGLYWTLTLDHRAVTLSTASPYDTLRLTATPRTAAGQPLTELGTPTYVSTDVGKVRVEADGLLRAVGVASGIKVAAKLTLGDITHTDTVVVNVTDATPPVLASLSIQPIAPDSAKTAPDVEKLLSTRATDPDGNPIDGIVVHYVSSDETTAKIGPWTGRITPIRPGEVTFYATATAFGVTKADTLPFTVGLPIWAVVVVTKRVDASGNPIVRFEPPAMVLGVGAGVVWQNGTGEAVDVVFEDPTNVVQADQHCALFGGFTGLTEPFCGAGNIAAWTAADTTGANVMLQWRTRQLAAPGTYRYRSELHGVAGTIVVQ